MDRRAAGTLAGVPFGALMVAVFGFVVLAAVACGNGPAAVPPPVTPGSPLTSHSASPATPYGQLVIRDVGNNGGGPPGFLACMGRHGITEQNTVNADERGGPTHAEVLSALYACNTAVPAPLPRSR